MLCLNFSRIIGGVNLRHLGLYRDLLLFRLRCLQCSLCHHLLGRVLLLLRRRLGKQGIPIFNPDHGEDALVNCRLIEILRVFLGQRVNGDGLLDSQRLARAVRIGTRNNVLVIQRRREPNHILIERWRLVGSPNALGVFLE